MIEILILNKTLFFDEIFEAQTLWEKVVAIHVLFVVLKIFQCWESQVIVKNCPCYEIADKNFKGASHICQPYYLIIWLIKTFETIKETKNKYQDYPHILIPCISLFCMCLVCHQRDNSCAQICWRLFIVLTTIWSEKSLGVNALLNYWVKRNNKY